MGAVLRGHHGLKAGDMHFHSLLGLANWSDRQTVGPVTRLVGAIASGISGVVLFRGALVQSGL